MRQASTVRVHENDTVAGKTMQREQEEKREGSEKTNAHENLLSEPSKWNEPALVKNLSPCFMGKQTRFFFPQFRMPYAAHSRSHSGIGNLRGHWQTIAPALFRRVRLVTVKRERLELPDGDFLDLDWAPDNGSDRLVILTHGLEGTSSDSIIQGMARACLQQGWDVLAWNFRGCSGEPNRLLVSYHSGATGDLETVLEHALSTGRHRRVDLIGFSLGGNVTLKFLGEKGTRLDPRVGRAVAFSVPCDLASSSQHLAHWSNRIYMQRFLSSLRRKMLEKIHRFPGQLEDLGLAGMRTFREFDEAYTAPIHGFRGAEDYWEKASSLPFLSEISIPTLLVNARNDPFLAPPCFPEEVSMKNPSFYLEAPLNGGHLGFLPTRNGSLSGAEERALQFFCQQVPSS